MSDDRVTRTPSDECPASSRSLSGRFVKGEPGPNLRHGGRSILVRLEIIEARRAELEDHRAAIFADMGGRESVSRVKADPVERYLETSLIAEWLGGNLLADGVLTGKGRARAASTLYLQVLDRVARLAMALGLERRSRKIDLTDYLEQRYGARAEDSTSEPVPGQPIDAAPGSQDAPTADAEGLPAPAAEVAPDAERTRAEGDGA